MVDWDRQALARLTELHAARPRGPVVVCPTEVIIGSLLGMLHSVLPVIAGGFLYLARTRLQTDGEWPPELQPSAMEPQLLVYGVVAILGVVGGVVALRRSNGGRRILEFTLITHVLVDLALALRWPVTYAQRPEYGESAGVLFLMCAGAAATVLLWWGTPAAVCVFLLERRASRTWFRRE